MAGGPRCWGSALHAWGSYRYSLEATDSYIVRSSIGCARVRRDGCKNGGEKFSRPRIWQVDPEKGVEREYF